MLRCITEFSFVPITITQCERAFENHSDTSLIVVNEHQQVIFSSIQAYGHVLRMSPLFWPIGKLMLLYKGHPARPDSNIVPTRLMFRQRSIPIAFIGAALVWMLMFVSLENTRHTLDAAVEPEDNATWIIHFLDSHRDLSKTLGVDLGLQVRWNMFDSPPRQCGWYHIPARMHKDGPYNGSLIDVHKVRHYPNSDLNVTWERPEYPTYQHNSPLWHAWYELMFSAAKADRDEMNFKLESTARFYCRTYPAIKVLHIVHTIERYNFTTYLTTVRNETLWAKTCEDHAGHVGKRPKKPNLLADPTERYSDREI